ncbi:MAG: hypothetical protein ACYDH9_08105 [Limisphaerales bacterium]
MNTITFRPPAELREHKILSAWPVLAADDEDFVNLRENIREFGINDPLKITDQGEIVDGRHRWRAAKALKLVCVPCVLVPDDRIVSTALSGLACRRNFTKAAVAYLAYPLLRDAHEEARRHQSENLQKGQCSPVATSGRNGTTVEEIAQNLGVNRRTFERAAAVHALFAKYPKYKARFEPRILGRESGDEHEDSRPLGLGAVTKAIGYLEAVKECPSKRRGGAPDAPREVKLFSLAFDTLTGRYAYWTKFDADAKSAAMPVIDHAIEKMPDDLLARVLCKVKAESRQRSQEVARE